MVLWQLTIDANDPALLARFWAPTTWHAHYRSRLYPTGRDNALPLERRIAIVEAKVAELAGLGISAIRRTRHPCDYLLDGAGAAVALLAIRLSARSSGRAWPPGRPAPTDLAALFNCGWLLLLEVLVAVPRATSLDAA